MGKLKVGYVAGFMQGFSAKGLELFKNYTKHLLKIADKMDFDLHIIKTVMDNMEDAVKIRKEIDSKNLDFVLLFHPSYINGDFVYEIMKSCANFGLWAIEELKEDGPINYASFINLSQNMGIVKHNYLNNEKKVKWFFGDINNNLFKERFEITIKVLKTLKKVKNSKVAQIGKLADGHINHMIDPRQVYKNLGVDVSRDYEVEDIITLSKEITDSIVEKELSKIKSIVKIKRVSEDKIVNSIKMYLAIKRIVRENNYTAVAFSCQTKLMILKEMVGCLINSLLNSDGIVAGCEADVLGTISMLILNNITGEEVALMDLARFDERDDSILLWHCGSAPFEMANNNEITCEKHYFADYDEKIENCGPVTDLVFKKSNVTVFRLSGEGDEFYYFTGKFFNTNKKSFCGSRGWVNDLKLYQEPIKLMDFINTILLNGLPHHFSIVLDKAGPYIEEFAYWANLKKIKKYDYRDYLYLSN